MKHALRVTAPGDREIVMTRTFDAPRKLVWRAMTEPGLLRRWLFGPPGWEMTRCDEDPRVGGRFRYEWRNADGREMAMTGVYREVTEPTRIVRTETFETGCDGQAGEQIATLDLIEAGATTLVTVTVLFPTKEARDGMIASGMEHGVALGYDRLDTLFADMV